MDCFINECVESSDNGEYLIPMFSVPLLHLRVTNWDEKKQELLKIYDVISKELPNGENIFISKKETDVATDYHYNFETGENYNQEIENILIDELQEVANVFECSLEVNTTWFELAKKNQFHQAHNHGPIGYSCVVFIEYDENVHFPTRFLTPITAADENYVIAPPNISEGSMLIFPSYVNHYTEANETDDERLILSFNLAVERSKKDFSSSYYTA